MLNIGVIGAGLAGLYLSNTLAKKSMLTLFEKSRGVGGRIATRRAEPYEFNHGTQYFKIKNQSFKKFLSPLIKKKIIKPWHANYVEIKKNKIIKQIKWNEETAHFIGYPKMNLIGKSFLNKLNIKLSCNVDSLKKRFDSWYIYDNSKICYGPFDWIIFCIPPEQVLNLLSKKFKYYHILRTVKMRSAFSLMLGFKEFKKPNFDAALVVNEDINWITITEKIKSNHTYFNLLINTSYDFAENNSEQCKEKISKYLVERSSDILGMKLSNFQHQALHFWRYAMSEKKNNYGSFVDNSLRVVVCGDWCMNGRVEGAFLSALNASKKILKYL